MTKRHGLNTEPPLPPQLPRHRATLHDAADFGAELAVNDRPPRHEGELVRLLEHGELAAR
jgi:hypothetical protein